MGTCVCTIGTCAGTADMCMSLKEMCVDTAGMSRYVCRHGRDLCTCCMYVCRYYY
jgi:hypothetical protein